MGNKHRASKDRNRVDPRTKKRSRKHAMSNSTCPSDSFLATTAATTTTTTTTTTITNADRMENTSTSLSCGASSSMSPCSSTAFEASSSPGHPLIVVKGLQQLQKGKLRNQKDIYLV